MVSHSSLLVAGDHDDVDKKGDGSENVIEEVSGVHVGGSTFFFCFVIFILDPR